MTFVEKVLGAPEGAVVFRKPDLILTHDNTSSIFQTFRKMGGEKVSDPGQMVVVLDHNAPPADAKLATQYQDIRDIVAAQGIKKFYDSGMGICHQMMSKHARPGMIIVGSDSHTCTAGAFNALAAGIDRTEAAGIWKRGETWFLVPPSMRINLTGKLRPGVSAKDLSLWIIGMLGSDGANYMSIEFHGEGVATLNVSDRMTVANLASEMGAKNAVFPADEVLCNYIGSNVKGVWADEGAEYQKHISIDLAGVFPLVAAPHHVDNIKSVASVAGTEVHEGLIGTCTNGRIEDLRTAASVLKGAKVKEGFQLHIIPASKEIYLQAIREGLITDLIEAGANILSPSCGPCLGTGQGIPASGHTVISTANRNFLGRMGNKEASIFLASPATVASSAITGVITDPRIARGNEIFPFNPPQSKTNTIAKGENRREGNVWNYADVDNLNTDQMFAGKHTYSVLSSDADAIVPLLFGDFDSSFSKNAEAGDIIIAGDNFGCGSSREHPSVGLAHLGIRAVIIKSVNRIFYRSSINQGLPLIVHREAVESYKPGDRVEIDFEKGSLTVGEQRFSFEPLPPELKEIIEKKGLVNWIKTA
ncbi:MAG: 3-isopropylmalate dehydratase large subunit [Bacteroidales bacterium]|nr:3-isopropylmalate dehydratase large subunit [Bacteroidales bacterium]HPQ63376.1 aconitase/3-isopropylmalate dehydratase large subunit family protein [Bacteroidales bacterium]HRW28224.1 aconitase/3-isopropylmalate dehydratase large subunit family protein [Bacteroidales bacterium]